MKEKKGINESHQRSIDPAAATISASTHSSLSFTDNRSSTANLKRVAEGINNSPQSIAQRQVQEQMDANPTVAPLPVQRAPEEEGELLQGKFDAAPPTNKTGMPDDLKLGIEPLSGMDMSDVRVYRNSDKPAQLNALAYAQGNDIHLGTGQEQHLPHEAWHVVQQRQGRVRPTLQMAGRALQMKDRDISEISPSISRATPLIVQLCSNKRKRDGGSTDEPDVIKKSRLEDGSVKKKRVYKARGAKSKKRNYYEEGGGEYMSTKEDPTFNGARLYGDSTKLAKTRYSRGDKDDAFEIWKKDREAQHLIPACLAKTYKSLQGIIDSEENGMMLPANLKDGDKKPTHRKPNHRDHPIYTNNVTNLIRSVLTLHGVNANQKTFYLVMEVLRKVHNNSDCEYVDDIPFNVFINQWNSDHPGSTIN